MKAVRNLNELLKKAELFLGTAGLLFIFLLISVNVIKRYFFHSAWGWSGELNGFIYAWVAFLSAAYSLADDKHVRITLLEERLGLKTGHVIRTFTDIFAVIGFVWLCFPTYSALRSMTYTSALRWPKGVVYSGLLVGFILYIIHLCIQVIRHLYFIRYEKDILEEE